MIDTDFVLWALGVIVGFITSLLFLVLYEIHCYFVMKASEIDKKDFKKFRMWLRNNKKNVK